MFIVLRSSSIPYNADPSNLKSDTPCSHSQRLSLHQSNLSSDVPLGKSWGSGRVGMEWDMPSFFVLREVLVLQSKFGTVVHLFECEISHPLRLWSLLSAPVALWMFNGFDYVREASSGLEG
ncbi:hypothetical protein Scep_023503 [Stephania cephalantha]|uniref:Uncharacterized protein n=1 Tax=Stephania cephalantha TaxID=152367 RepID=A0AAP0F1Z0_9MAGN